MTAVRSLSVARGVAQRGVRKLKKTPPLLVAPMIVPLFFFAAFAGALSAMGKSKSFGYYNFTAFVFVFVLYMASMLVGVFTAFDIASDFETGMGRRLMLAAPRRMAIVGGYLMVAFGRAVIANVVVWGVALAVGMPVRGSALQIAAIVALALLLNLAATLYGAGIALRFQSASAGTLVLIPIYMALFITPVFTTRDGLTDWLKAVAGVNPLTAPIEAGRGLLADDPVSVALAFGAAVGLVAVLFVWAVLGMRKAGKG
ncbi:MAG: type transport system permease protein [Solirubrobacteraceae bacterium]|nr:type transport system permease protein [Solirubrobacteraceae bacterium]